MIRAVNLGRSVVSRRLLLLAALVTAGVLLVPGAGASPGRFELVFDGHHGPPMDTSYRHEGTFTASAPFCPSGTMGDVAHYGENAVRVSTCDDGSGTITLRVGTLPAEHALNGTGFWQITGGTGAYAALRGKGTWTTVPIGGETARFISTSRGIADLDDQPPTITITRGTAAKLQRPKGFYLIRLVFSAPDNVEGNTVSYRVLLSSRTKNWTRTGRTVSGPVKLSLRVRPPKSARRITLHVSASDPLDNESQRSRSIKLRR